MMGYVSGAEKSKSTTPAPIVAKEKPAIPEAFLTGSDYTTENLTKNFRETYILRENENKLSLFIRYSNGDEQIHSEYEVAVNLLPKSDRERLWEGIEFESVNDVIGFIEDYMG